MKYLSKAILFCIIISSSCVSEDFDMPPIGGTDPNLEVSHSIRALKSLHVLGSFQEITEEIVIAGQVVSSDKEGNLFRVLYIQDETAGIEVRIDETDLNNTFPVGRNVFVKCKGLWLGDFNNNIQLGLDLDIEIDPSTGAQSINGISRIPSILLDEFLFPGRLLTPPTPHRFDIDDLLSVDFDALLINNIGTLVELVNTEFIITDANVSFADPTTNTTENRIIKSCTGQEILVRTSGFATFANALTPSLNGNLRGILSIFGDDIQLILRDTLDIDMREERCDGRSVFCEGAEFLISDLRDLFLEGGDLPEGNITGVVTSDFTMNNINERNLFFEDGSAAIAIRFVGTHIFPLGSRLRFGLCGAQFNEFGGLLQVSNVSFLYAENQGRESPTPRVTTIAEVLSNKEKWESSLVKIENAEIKGGSSFGDNNIVVDDGTGQISLFTFNSASFSDEQIPAGMVSIIANLSEFNGTSQLTLRSSSDVVRE